MKIGFDLDKVFIDTPPFIPDRVIERLYRKKTNGDLLYRMPSKKERIIRILSHNPLFRPPIKKNLNFLQQLSQTDHSLYLISSRFGFLRTVTERIVKNHKFNALFKEIYFNYENRQPHIFKNEKINQLKLDKYIDDDLYLLKYIASKNNKIKLYWLNKKINKKISNSIIGITKIEDILKI
jgi:hypothetical protein